MFSKLQSSSRKQRRKTSILKVKQGESEISWKDTAESSTFQFRLGMNHIEQNRHDKLQVRIFEKELFRSKKLLGNVIVSMAGVGKEESSP